MFFFLVQPTKRSFYSPLYGSLTLCALSVPLFPSHFRLCLFSHRKIIKADIPKRESIKTPSTVGLLKAVAQKNINLRKAVIPLQHQENLILRVFFFIFRSGFFHSIKSHSVWKFLSKKILLSLFFLTKIQIWF